MWQYANVPIGCTVMPHGNCGTLAYFAYWHIIIVFAKVASFFGTFIHSFRFIIQRNEN